VNRATSLRAAIARNTLAGWLNHIAATGSSVIFTPLIVHGFGASTYGTWLVLAQLCGYISILDLGVQSAVLKYVSRARATNDRDAIDSLLSTALALHSVLALTGFLILWLLSPLLIALLNLGEVSWESASAALLVAGLGAALNLPFGIFGAALKGYLRLDLVSWVGVLSIAVRGVVLVVAVLLGLGLIGLAWAASVASLVGGIGSTALFFRQTHWRLRFRIRSEALGQLVSFGLYAVLGTLGWYLAYASDAVVIGTALTTIDVARFGIASTVVVLLSGAVGAFSGSFLPLGSALDAQANGEALQRSYVMGTKIALVIGLPWVIALGFCGPDLLSLWVGPELGEISGRFLRVLMAAYLPAIANSVGFQIALGAGLHRQVALLSAFEGVCHVGLAYVLAVRFGLYGVGIAALIVTFSMHGIIWPLYLSTRLKIALRRYWNEGLRPAFVPALPAVVIYGMFHLVAPDRGGLWRIAAAALVLLVYWFCAVFICFTRGERRAWVQQAKNGWPFDGAVFGRGSI